MRLNSTILIAALFTCSAYAADLGGVVLGSRANPDSLTKLGITAGAGQVEPGRYSGTKRFELVDAKTAVEVGQSGTVTQIYADFDSLMIESIHEMAQRKWGKPIDSGAMVMADGNLEKIWIWDTKDGAEITLVSYDTTIEHGSLTRGSLTMISKASADAKRGPKGSPL